MSTVHTFFQLLIGYVLSVIPCENWTPFLKFVAESETILGQSVPLINNHKLQLMTAYYVSVDETVYSSSDKRHLLLKILSSYELLQLCLSSS